MNIYLAADKRFSAFEWGKTVISYITLFAKKYGMGLLEFNPNLPPDTGYLIVVGVDVVWMEEIAKRIKNTDLIVIQFMGKSDMFANRVIKFAFNQKSVIENSVDLLKKNSRVKTAFFGVQRNDSSDLHKAEIFKNIYSAENVYAIEDKISETFDRFFEKLSLYDSVICANDLIAVYLLKRLKKLGINVPGDIYVIGNGNLWIGSHISPTLTTVRYDTEAAVDIAFQLLRSEQVSRLANRIDFVLNTDIIIRETTDCHRSDACLTHLYIPAKENTGGMISDEEIREIRNVDSGMISLSPTDMAVLKELYTGATYNEIAQRVFLTQDSVKYHVKKIYSTMGVHDSSALRTLLDDNLIKPDLL